MKPSTLIPFPLQQVLIGICLACYLMTGLVVLFGHKAEDTKQDSSYEMQVEPLIIFNRLSQDILHLRIHMQDAQQKNGATQQRTDLDTAEIHLHEISSLRNDLMSLQSHAHTLTDLQRFQAIAQQINQKTSVALQLPSDELTSYLKNERYFELLHNAKEIISALETEQQKYVLTYFAEEHEEERNQAIMIGGLIFLGSLAALFALISSIRSSQKIKQQAVQLAQDPLTGLWSRQTLEKDLNHCLSNDLQKDFPHALLYIDLDGFKTINDVCGHDAGDIVLKQVSSLLKSVGSIHQRVYRLGGDEFAILISNRFPSDVKAQAESLRQLISQHRFVIAQHLFHIGTSIGIVHFHKDWLSPGQVMQVADAACYTAKAAGKNQIHEYAENDLAVETRLSSASWISRLEHALEHHQFVLFAQRIVPAHGQHKMLHCEVLLRLLDENGQLIPPVRFLPAAEQHQLMFRIDLWVLANTLSLLGRHADKMDLVHTISINLSGKTLSDPRFLEEAIQLFRKAVFPSEKICLEITETSAISNLEQAKMVMNELGKIGVKFALDDFGSGISSFGYLKALPIQYIKIDGQFVRAMLIDDVSFVTVKSITEIGHTLKRQVIAEFVETENIATSLSNMGVDLLQGYAVHKPELLETLIQHALEE
ncbi:EAL domain-containing protein [Leeia sp. TBRC 13508]|uniref:EAL domain-containing protein n=1 Tax=Leeia speluncae TaxID=2884804 RepID=A0ABS8D706_9NEIS|nr:EAL domain-containing protein [Leeia speluncae]MCB6183976.1 EAL domain-containing protein [Leeia speluncae]